jgi:heptosyltransferase-1
MFYNKSVQVPLHYHAVDRSRAVAASAMNLSIPNRQAFPPQFYPAAYIQQLQQLANPLGLSRDSYVMFFHATARIAKGWPQDHWIALGQFLASNNLTVVLPWGNEQEKTISQALAQEIPGSLVPRAFSIQEVFVINAQSKLVIGVDTGLTHLAAVLGIPTIELYVDSPKWKTEGYWSRQVINLGDKQQSPSLQEVITASTSLII